MSTEPGPFDACPECDGKGRVQIMDWEMPVGYEPCDCIRRRADVPADITQAAADEFHRVNEQDGTTWGDAIESALQVALAMLPEPADPIHTEALQCAVERVRDAETAAREARADHEFAMRDQSMLCETILRLVDGESLGPLDKAAIAYARSFRDAEGVSRVDGTTVIDGRVFEVRPVAGIGPNGSNCAFLRPVKEAS